MAFYTGQYYHLYNRGNNRQTIFLERENYVFFLRRIREHLVRMDSTQTSDVCTAPRATIIAYCLMPNHFHLLVRPNDEQLSRHMRRLSISYTKAMNKRYDRVGSLFQGRLKAIMVDRDAYMIHLSRYIHLNPVLAGLVESPEHWEFSSYRDYVGMRQGTLPSPDAVLSQFASATAYRDFVVQYADHDQRLIGHLTFEQES